MTGHLDGHPMRHKVMGGDYNEETHLLQHDVMEDETWDLMQEINRKLDILLVRTAPKTKAVKKRAAIKHDYPEAFEHIVRAYPQRKPSGSKRAAYAAYSTRQQEGFTYKEMLEGARRYCKYTDAEGLTGGRYVMMLSTFLGPRCEFQNEWEIPEPEVKQPQTDGEWFAAGLAKGLQPRPGESMADFKQRVQRTR